MTPFAYVLLYVSCAWGVLAQVAEWRGGRRRGVYILILPPAETRVVARE